MKSLYLAKDIALEVRDWAESLVEDRNWKGDLAGYCAIASAELHDRLKMAKIDAMIGVTTDYKEWSSHAYVLVGDHILDVTATQFSKFKLPAVTLLHEKEAEQYWFYRNTQLFKDRKDLRKYQISEGWPREQVAYSKAAIVKKLEAIS